MRRRQLAAAGCLVVASIVVTTSDAGALNCLGGTYWAGQGSYGLEWSGATGYLNTNVITLNNAGQLVSYVDIDDQYTTQRCPGLPGRLCWQQV